MPSARSPRPTAPHPHRSPGAVMERDLWAQDRAVTAPPGAEAPGPCAPGPWPQAPPPGRSHNLHGPAPVRSLAAVAGGRA